MVLVGDDEEGEPWVHEREPRNVSRQREERGPHPLAFEEIGHVAQRDVAQVESSPLLGGGLAPLLDRFPLVSRRRHRVGGGPQPASLDVQAILELGELPGEVDGVGRGLK